MKRQLQSAKKMQSLSLNFRSDVDIQYYLPRYVLSRIDIFESGKSRAVPIKIGTSGDRIEFVEAVNRDSAFRSIADLMTSTLWVLQRTHPV